jgi:hypothetical protein
MGKKNGRTCEKNALRLPENNKKEEKISYESPEIGENNRRFRVRYDSISPAGY